MSSKNSSKIVSIESGPRFALDAIKMKDTAAFFWVQFLVMYTVKWIFFIMLSLVTWDREGMPIICVMCWFRDFRLVLSLGSVIIRLGICDSRFV